MSKLNNCSARTRSFNEKATSAPVKAAIPLHDICPCYRPKMALA